jgi:ketosteroid isomerase-like protein
MKGFFWVVLSVALVSGCAQQTATAPAAPAISATPAAGAEALVAQLERDWANAIVKKDVAALERLIADDFSGTSSNGQRYTKAEAIEDIKSGTYVAERMDLDNVNVRVYGDTAVVTLGQIEKSKYGNEECSGRYLFTNVWVKRNGEWQAVASHGTPSPLHL